ncbi:MAG TPA: ribosome assembly cofactor RimP [Bacteroidia bacterium]|nr:ribosome assembly cofactor RimP [Bacteroidia bacterium]
MSPFLLGMISKQRIEGIVNEFITNSDLFLVEVRTGPSRITVFVDKPSGVTLDECAALNRYISNVLEPEGVWESCELEVSSPGMDQPLKVLPQYLRRIGREIRVITVDGSEHNGKLDAADDEGISLTEIIVEKENKKRIRKEIASRISFSNIKETKLKLSFKI